MWIDISFTILFTIEMIINVIALGFIYNKKQKAYLKNPWNVLDFVVVVTSLIDAA